ncbi:Hsp70 family protein [Paenibacillus alkaliterrae]|uniref:Hsp70 family protein n=1 Tax=Paenibacillus alkaliterrae TaxID=320909 RepID=UPI001F29E014|nr:Hsp70 family protein [Paenibacillus alkaliterrae]MCF2940702.1 Hsp70 family protein [Paenibacillus alkaliterrae]
MSSHEQERTGAHAFRPTVGIDLGTTNSAVAFIRNGQPTIIRSPRDEAIIPSVVWIDPKDKAVVGEDARAALVAMPDRTIAAVKRKMGSEERIALAGRELLPQEISALILKELKGYADTLYGDGEKEAVITVPAYFTDAQRRATKEAGELAGFVVERIINEPTAAALAFGLNHVDEDRVFIVYDLGGGTFDVSVVEMMSGIMEVKASAGNNFLGGEDFDWRLVDLFAEQMLADHAVDPRDDIRAKALLKEEAERVKKQLSDELTAEVSLPFVTVKDNRPVGLTMQVSREQFLKLIEDKLDETMDCIRSVLQDSGLKPQDIDEILLVGGSTRIPHVHTRIADFFGKQPRKDVNPDEAVALGAAVQAGLKSGLLSESGLIATDVAPYSMGIAVLKESIGMRVKPGGFAPIITRNTTIPVTKTERFQTSSPGQTTVEIEVYQGEHEWVKRNLLLGKFLLEDIPENWKEQEKLDVTFRYNLNGILEVTAQCVSTGYNMTVTLQDGLDRNSREQFLNSTVQLEQLWSGPDLEPDEDEEALDWAEAWEALDAEAEIDLEDEDELDELPERMSEDEFRKESVQLLERLDALARSGDRAVQEQAKEMIRELKAAMESSDLDELSEQIDSATDLLIEAEL